jgi:alkylhydroperoxidase/carboxymuconolactone decarboxylase family protein YurZ
MDRVRDRMLPRPPGSMAEDDERAAPGGAAFASQFRLPESEAVEELERMVGKRMAEEAINASAAAWMDDCLSLRDRSLVVVAALVALGGLAARLRTHVRRALDHGATAEELEALALLAVYVG